MNIFEKNEKVLKKYRGHLYEHILKQKYTDRERKLVIYNDIARDGNKYMTIVSDVNSYRLNSTYRPIDEAIKWSKSCFEDNNLIRIISVYGFGNGYFIRELLNRCNERSIILVYEPFISVFMNVIREYDISDIIENKRIFLYVGQEAFKDFSEIYVHFVGIMNVYISYEITIPQYEHIIPEDYDFFVRRVLGYKKDLVSTINTCARYGRVFNENIFYSMNNIKGSSYIGDLKNKFYKEIPAIIVAAGPSLNKNMLELRKLKNKAFIVSTDTAFNTLLSNGIIPDVVMSCDPIKRWENDHKEFSEVPLICTFECNYEMKEIHKGKRIYMSASKIADVILKQVLEDNMKIPLSGSVATLAVSMCVELGFNKIVFVGQDLAYGEDGKTHVDHSESTTSPCIMEVEGIYGGVVKTRPDWSGYISTLEQMIYKNSNIEYIDATEGGALLHGSRIMKLSEVAERFKGNYCEFANVLNAMPIRFDDECIIKINELIEQYKLQIDCVREKTKKMLKLCDKIIIDIKKESFREDDYKVKEFKKLFGEINVNEIISFLHNYSMVDIKGDVFNSNKGMEDEQSTWLNHYQCYRNIIESMYNATPFVKELLVKDYS